MADTKIPSKSERPSGITALGIIYIIFGVLMIVTVAMVAGLSIKTDQLIRFMPRYHPNL